MYNNLPFYVCDNKNCNCVIQEIEQFRKDLKENFPVPDSPLLDTDVQVAFRIPSGSIKKYVFNSNADTKVLIID